MLCGGLGRFEKERLDGAGGAELALLLFFILYSFLSSLSLLYIM